MYLKYYLETREKFGLSAFYLVRSCIYWANVALPGSEGWYFRPQLDKAEAEQPWARGVEAPPGTVNILPWSDYKAKCL